MGEAIELFVSKFGGSSLADAGQFKKVIAIIKGDPRRQYIVVSAPGKWGKYTLKVTDLLYGLCLHMPGADRAKITQKIEEKSRDLIADMDSGKIFIMLEERFRKIIRGLKLAFNLSTSLDELNRDFERCDQDAVVAWGECVAAKILAAACDFDFHDACRVIRFDGAFSMEETMKMSPALLSQRRPCVIPGFYGMDADGSIKTFTRGGSDRSGAIVAKMVKADMYEIWGDTSGIRMTDPRIVPHAKRIERMSYEEASEMAYGGANILHPETTFPAEEEGIPIHLLNTNEPDAPGTLILSSGQDLGERLGSIVGIAGRRGFVVITLKKMLMNGEVGFISRASGVFADHDVSIEHVPGGMRTLSFIVSKEHLNGKLPAVIDDLERECAPVEVLVEHNLALICTVGKGMAHKPGIAANLLRAVGQAQISVHVISQGSNELNIITGVSEDVYEDAVRAIYEVFAD